MSKRVLHVLPHPGGGGETYVDALGPMDGYRFERMYLSPTSDAGGVAALAVARGCLSALRLTRAYDLIHVHGEIAGAVSLPAMAASRAVVTMHGLHLLRRTHGLSGLAARANVRMIARTCRRVICVSRAEQDELEEVLSRATTTRLRVVVNGVPPTPPVSPEERAAARRELGLDETTSAAVFVGGLDPHKEPLLVARAVAGLAEDGVRVSLLVAGSGPLARELGRLSAAAPAAVRLLGPRSDIRRVLAAGDFFVLPSQREGLSFALLEAMAAGLAPVVSDAPGNPEAVGDAGVVVRRGDVDGFAAAFRRLAVDPGESRSLGERARERVLREFRADVMVERTRDVYDEALGIRRE